MTLQDNTQTMVNAVKQKNGRKLKRKIPRKIGQEYEKSDVMHPSENLYGKLSFFDIQKEPHLEPPLIRLV